MELVANYPPELEVNVYRQLHNDLAHMSDEALSEHYKLHGRSEGRIGNRLVQRESFTALIGPDVKALEIGPLATPLLKGENVRYCDIMDQEGLKERAIGIGLDPNQVPFISYVLGPEGLDGIKEDFDAVLSSHCIEHQPDLVRHLQQVQRRLEARGGRYFVLAPDKRYCFDHYISETTIADIIDAHYGARTVHTLRNVIEHRALSTHNDAVVHWQAHAAKQTIDSTKIRDAINEWLSANGSYIDVHAWYLTPDSFAENIGLLRHLGFIQLSVERLYATRYGAGEFWAILSL